MTSQSPRIYVYKITFEEVPHYYYGSHKEKRFGEYYMGSPKTHKEYWKLYTARKEYIEFFEHTEEGYTEARKFEDSLIAPVLNDELCLNEHVGGLYSLETCRKAGKISHENGVGIHGRPREEVIENARKAGKIGGKIGGKRGGKASTSQKWQCTITGYTSTACGLTSYQNKRRIDTSNRIKLDEPRSWEITFEDGRVIVIFQTLKDWSEENGYIYESILSVRIGKTRIYRDVIKVVSL